MALPTDARFAATHVARLGQSITAWRSHQRARLASLRDQCASLDKGLRDRMTGHIQHVVKDLRIFMTMVLGLVILWPDWALPHRFVSGLGVVGHASPSNLFPEDPVKASRSAAQLLGPEADAWNLKVAKDPTQPNEADKILWDKTFKAKKAGKLKGPYSKAQLDKLFGKGEWRAIRRRLVWSASHGI